MARPVRSERDEQVEGGLQLWAVWCESGAVLAASTASLQSRMMAAGPGVLQLGSGGSSPLVDDDEIEAVIEAAVCQLTVQDLLSADVLRLEYQADMYRMLRRRNIHCPNRQAIVSGGQRYRADLLGINLQQYRRKLKKARSAVGSALETFRER